MNQSRNKQVTVSCQISSTWQDKIQKIAADRNTSQAEIIGEAIALYLGEVGANSSDRLIKLEGEVAVFKQMLSQLNVTVTRLQQQVNLGSIPRSPVSQPRFENAIAEELKEMEEDIEDEPDEVLSDFLEPN
ncbi:hypothetical protein [Spirulina sp. 06S082]|uniref:hypothetical protein n=1 Tax=Spirulina sp. 06S082 TaxID=3110248 RepID=UPI002B1F493E|nr:hypothetical protein [Spirulina sp. 06S082]MEA5470942.1 hypothetical protein [Spirulina sp. 06S082]